MPPRPRRRLAEARENISRGVVRHCGRGPHARQRVGPRRDPRDQGAHARHRDRRDLRDAVAGLGDRVLRAQGLRLRARSRSTSTSCSARSSARSSIARSSPRTGGWCGSSAWSTRSATSCATCSRPSSWSSACCDRLMRGLGVDASAARLLNPETSEYDLRVIKAPEAVLRAWGGDDAGCAARRATSCSRRARRCGSTTSTPGSTPTTAARITGPIGAERADVRRRRSDRRADGRLPGAGAVHAPGRAAAGRHRQPGRGRRAERAAARLRPRRQAGVGGDLRRDGRRDRRLRPPRPSAARQRGARRVPRPPGDRAPRADAATRSACAAARSRSARSAAPPAAPACTTK